MAAATQKQFREQISALVEALLSKPLLPRAAGKSHAIHDALWGMVSLQPHEITLLDTELLQRLHRLRQLGSAHMIFPGANHTRFEHTLGVMHLCGRICKELNQRRDGSVDRDQQDNLRLAALCHDLGHGPFSHCSEGFFKTLAPLPELAEQNPGSGAAELLSVEIVKSKPFRDFLIQLNEKYNTNLDADFIARAISATLPKEQRYLGEIIHGPCDADKLDYLNRDSKYCGLQSQVDIERIIRLLDRVATDEGDRLVVRQDALPALSQLLHNRSHLFSVVYQHSVARSFTAMLQTALRLAVDEKTKVCGRNLHNPSDFLWLYDDWLLAPGSGGGRSAGKLLEDLRKRRLYKTALAIEDRHLNDEERTPLIDQCQRGELAARIAKRSDADAHEVIIDCGIEQENSEALRMLIGDSKSQQLLGEVLKLKDQKITLHGFLKRHLILCPAGMREKVAAAAKQELKSEVPKRALFVGG